MTILQLNERPMTDEPDQAVPGPVLGPPRTLTDILDTLGRIESAADALASVARGEFPRLARCDDESAARLVCSWAREVHHICDSDQDQPLGSPTCSSTWQLTAQRGESISEWLGSDLLGRPPANLYPTGAGRLIGCEAELQMLDQERMIDCAQLVRARAMAIVSWLRSQVAALRDALVPDIVLVKRHREVWVQYGQEWALAAPTMFDEEWAFLSRLQAEGEARLGKKKLQRLKDKLCELHPIIESARQPLDADGRSMYRVRSPMKKKLKSRTIRP